MAALKHRATPKRLTRREEEAEKAALTHRHSAQGEAISGGRGATTRRQTNRHAEGRTLAELKHRATTERADAARGGGEREGGAGVPPLGGGGLEGVGGVDEGAGVGEGRFDGEVGD